MKVVSLILRAGLAFTFLYAGISSLIDPTPWVGFFPSFLLNIFPENILTIGFSVFEIALALWLLSGKYIEYSAGLAAVSLLGIVVFNFGAMLIVFRDIGLALSAIALILLHKDENNNTKQ